MGKKQQKGGGRIRKRRGKNQKREKEKAEKARRWDISKKGDEDLDKSRGRIKKGRKKN